VEAEEQMWAERRKHRRVALRSHCWCEAEGITLYAKIINASEGGCFVGTYAPLRPGSPARVRFTLEGLNREVTAEAVVAWVREAAADPRLSPGMGLRFTFIDEQSVNALRELVARRSSSGSNGNGHA
jgi:uncharacterized protein (TIGR02266 family)